MTRTITVPAHRRTPESASAGRPLRLVRRIGLVVLGVKFLCFCVWSMVLYQHFALTPDFAQYQQAWYLIAHGHLNPYDTVGNFAFWQNHGEFIMWPLALLYWVSPGGVGLLWLQDAGVVGAELVAFVWGCELARKYARERDAGWLAAAGLVLLLVNPWSWWSVSFDFHAECLAVLFIALLAWDLANGRRRAWLWVPLLIACGDVAGTYIFGLGLGLAVAVRGQRIRGGVVALVGIVAVLGFSAIHANLGSGHGLKAYDYLAAPGYSGSLTLTQLAKGLATHPAAVAAKMWEKRVDIWANLGASGLLGAAFLPLLPITAVVMVSNDLFRGFLFSEPLFQSLPIYVLLPAGTVAILAMLARRRRKTAIAVTALLVLQAVGWSVVWSPRTVSQWERVPSPTAATLAAVLAKIPPQDAVFVSQGVVGRFSQRRVVRPMNGHLPIQPGSDWFVFAPWVGIETQKPAAAMVFAGQLAGPLHAKLILDRNGVWVFRWTPPANLHRMNVPSGAAPLPAWCAPGAAGQAVLTGNPSTWHTASTGKPGYVADRLEWARMAGRFQAKVTLSTNGPVNVEVWDNTGNVMLARDTVPFTHGKLTVTLPVDATRDYHDPLYGGWGLFQAKFGGGPRGQRIEVRVWSPGGEKVSVYSAQLLTISH
jgi:Predicted membrane protein (DUF2079)